MQHIKITTKDLAQSYINASKGTQQIDGYLRTKLKNIEDLEDHINYLTGETEHWENLINGDQLSFNPSTKTFCIEQPEQGAIDTEKLFHRIETYRDWIWRAFNDAEIMPWEQHPIRDYGMIDDDCDPNDGFLYTLIQLLELHLGQQGLL